VICPNKAIYLGIDVGSISTNLLLMNEEREVIHVEYVRAEGKPIESTQQALSRAAQALGSSSTIAGVCTTGSAREIIGAIVGADIIKNEITTHARAAIHLQPNVQTIIEIGGQDSKITIVKNGTVVDFSMNFVCAAGTGSFLDSQAKRLNISIEQFSREAILSENPTHIAGRCTVFAESDMIHKQQIGHSQRDIIMGLCLGMVRNYLSNVCHGKKITPPIVFQGGVSANEGICRAFRDILKKDIIVPQYHMTMGAYGAALIAAESNIQQTKFQGFDIADATIQSRGFICQDCPNMCEIIEILNRDKVITRCGGRCGKWEELNLFDTITSAI
jgi:predicted CoA-substrate-specific enzyme activase